MVISVYLLKETREKSVIFDEDAVLTSSREDSGSLRGGGGGVGWVAVAGAPMAVWAPGRRLVFEHSEERQLR